VSRGHYRTVRRWRCQSAQRAHRTYAEEALWGKLRTASNGHEALTDLTGHIPDLMAEAAVPNCPPMAFAQSGRRPDSEQIAEKILRRPILAGPASNGMKR